MISTEYVQEIHQILIDKFGGSNGLRDRSALESALARPFQTFEGTQLYISVIEQAASLLESILVNHPFIDGNKRTGYTLMRLFLLGNQLDIISSQDNKYEFVIDVASGALKFEGIVSWLKLNTKSVNDR